MWTTSVRRSPIGGVRGLTQHVAVLVLPSPFWSNIAGQTEEQKHVLLLRKVVRVETPNHGKTAAAVDR